MSLIDQLFISGVWTPTAVQFDPVTGDVLVSADPSGTGEPISDTYHLVVSSRTGGTGTITVSASSNNPYNGRVKTGLNFDDTTEYDNIVPGAVLVLDNAAANGDSVDVTFGDPYGAFDASGVGAGVPTTGVRHRVINDGDSAVTDAVVKLLAQAVHVKITGQALEHIGPFAEGATEKLAGGGSNQVVPYALTISSTAGSGGSKTATLSIDGGAFGSDDILDLTTGTTQDGTLLKALGTTYPYQVVDGPLTDLVFSIDPDCVNGDKANVLIFASRFLQTAPDVAGVEGTYDTSDADLTETGQAAGTITSGGEAFYWTRFLVPSAANNESNPYPANVAIVASVSTAAGWTD